VLLDWITINDADLPAVGSEQPARHSDRGRLPCAVGPDQAEHLASRDRERHGIDRLESTVLLRHPIERDGRFHGSRYFGSSASTGIPGLSTPSRLSVLTFIRYTSFDRSAAVCTLRGVNSALGEMNVMLPCKR